MKRTGWLFGLILVVLGILVLVWPDLIRWFVGFGLIIMGIMAMLRR